MCGINGFNFNQPDLIEKMNRVIKHRGSDQKNIYYDDNFSLGHVSSSIIDLSEQGKQPLFNEDRSLALICNGEIYNFQEIRNKLEKNLSKNLIKQRKNFNLLKGVKLKTVSKLPLTGQISIDLKFLNRYLIPS